MEATDKPEDYLKKKDKKLKKLIETFGHTNIAGEKRELFDSIAKAVISQQLSNSASNSITKKIISIHGKRPFKSTKFISLTIEDLRECGISNSKIKTLKGIAQACLSKELTLKSFQDLTDNEAQKKLTAYWGIGPWTADIVMMFCLKRYDVIALGDVGLQNAHSLIYPEEKSLKDTSQLWRPYRAIAASYLWKFLDNPNKHPEIFKAFAKLN